MKQFCFLAFASLLLFSCKKQDSTHQSDTGTLDAQSISLVSTWLKNDSTKSPERKNRIANIKANLDFFKLSTEKLTDDETLVLVPLKKAFTSNLNKDKNPHHYLLLYKKGDGTVRNGNLVQYAPLATSDVSVLTANTFSKILSGQAVAVNGSISFLSIYDRFFTEVKYENGIKKSFSTLSTTKKSSQTASRPPLKFCIEWYLETTIFYPNGTTSTTEDYLYTTCYAKCHPNEICDIKEDDGFSGGSVCDDLAPQMDGSAMSIRQSVGAISATATTRSKSYSWKTFEQAWGLWSFSSHEIGVHKKVGSVWQWQSLTHQNISKSGYWAGGTVNCTLNTAIPQVALYNAGMELNYTMTFSLLFDGCPMAADKTYDSDSPIWHVNE